MATLYLEFFRMTAYINAAAIKAMAVPDGNSGEATTLKVSYCVQLTIPSVETYIVAIPVALEEREHEVS